MDRREQTTSRKRMRHRLKGWQYHVTVEVLVGEERKMRAWSFGGLKLTGAKLPP